MTKCKNCGNVMKRHDEEYGLYYKYEYFKCPYCGAQAVVTYKKESEIQRTKEGTRLQKGDKKMVAWYWLIVAFLLGNLFASFACDYFEEFWSSVIAGIWIVVIFIPYSIYSIFFRNTIKPIEKEWFEDRVNKWKKDDSKVFHVCGNLYFWIDPKAKRIYNKIFFVRVIDKQPKVCYNKDKERG